MSTSQSRRTAERERRARVEAMRAEQRRKARRQSRLVIGAGVLVAVGILLAVIVPLATRHSVRNAAAAIPGVVSYQHLSRVHTSKAVHYAQTPPVGGPHNPYWLNCGIYAKPVPNENAVHDLEHGAVWITYRPSLPAAQVATLRALVKAQPLTAGSHYVDLSPYPGLPAPIVVSAWGKQLRLQSATDPRLARFVHTYREGPQTPEPGAPCTGGVGSPLSP